MPLFVPFLWLPPSNIKIPLSGQTSHVCHFQLRAPVGISFGLWHLLEQEKLGLYFPTADLCVNSLRAEITGTDQDVLESANSPDFTIFSEPLKNSAISTPKLS